MYKNVVLTISTKQKLSPLWFKDCILPVICSILENIHYSYVSFFFIQCQCQTKDVGFFNGENVNGFEVYAKDFVIVPSHASLIWRLLSKCSKSSDFQYEMKYTLLFGPAGSGKFDYKHNITVRLLSQKVCNVYQIKIIFNSILYS